VPAPQHDLDLNLVLSFPVGGPVGSLGEGFDALVRAFLSVGKCCRRLRCVSNVLQK